MDRSKGGSPSRLERKCVHQPCVTFVFVYENPALSAFGGRDGVQCIDLKVRGTPIRKATNVIWGW